MKNNRKQIKDLTVGALVAALYVLLTLLSSILGLSSGVIQLRFSEALCILPIFFPSAVSGLFVGCVISNILSGAVVWDVIFGSLATLIGALGVLAMRRLPDKLIWLSTLPTVIANALIVPYVLVYAYGSTEALPFIMLTVFIGEAISAGVGGTLLYHSLKRVFPR